jgi:hypothetical protein
MKIKIELELNCTTKGDVFISELPDIFIDWSYPVLPRAGERVDNIIACFLPDEIKEKFKNVTVGEFFGKQERTADENLNKIIEIYENRTIYKFFCEETEPLVVKDIFWEYDEDKGIYPSFVITHHEDSEFFNNPNA